MPPGRRGCGPCAAPTPTYISLKSDPESAKNGTPASPATAFASRVLPVPGRAREQDALGNSASERVEFLGGREELDDLSKLGDHLVGTSDIVKRDPPFAAVIQLVPAPGESHSRPEASGIPRDHPEQRSANNQEHGRRDQGRGHRMIGRGVVIAVGDMNFEQFGQLVVALESQSGGPEPGGTMFARCGHQFTDDLRRADLDGPDLSLGQLHLELAVAKLLDRRSRGDPGAAGADRKENSESGPGPHP